MVVRDVRMTEYQGVIPIAVTGQIPAALQLELIVVQVLKQRAGRETKQTH